MGKKVLVPILTEREIEPDFVAHLRNQDIGDIVLLSVVDRSTQGDLPASVIGEKLKKAEAIRLGIANSMLEKKVTEHVEWGKWVEKIENISKLEKVDEVLIISTKETIELLPMLKERNINVVTFTIKGENNGPEKTPDSVL